LLVSLRCAARQQETGSGSSQAPLQLDDHDQGDVRVRVPTLPGCLGPLLVPANHRIKDLVAIVLAVWLPLAPLLFALWNSTVLIWMAMHLRRRLRQHAETAC
jgi:hypothetical protein